MKGSSLQYAPCIFVINTAYEYIGNYADAICAHLIGTTGFNCDNVLDMERQDTAHPALDWIEEHYITLYDEHGSSAYDLWSVSDDAGCTAVAIPFTEYPPKEVIDYILNQVNSLKKAQHRSHYSLQDIKVTGMWLIKQKITTEVAEVPFA